MNPTILNTNIQEFIDNHLKSDLTKLLFKGTPFNTVETKDIIEQIDAKKRCEKKLPTWFNTANIYYPNKLNIEQTSSETTAKYKSSLIHGSSIIDLTGGFGVDCFYFSKVFKTVTHCEINKSLSSIVHYNYKQLIINNIETFCDDGIVYLSKSNKTYDWIYLDPSRRHDSKGKVFFLNDCLPNVPKHLDLLFEHTKNILIKTSPLLDLSVGINELSTVKTVHIVALNNEVKELLWVLEKNYTGELSVETLNIKKDKVETFSTSLVKSSNLYSDCNYQLPLDFLYEPNAAILKSGAFSDVALQLKLNKLHKHTHLYTNNKLVEFPGRRFKIEKIINYNKKTVRALNIKKANITIRNFPERVEDIRKKFKIKDGGTDYLFFTTNMNNEKIVILAKPA
ncbi:class I SAM-dependent methyltransferase [uncultured Algibacter sp.]|uniref:THUMP-like domain-containing protein n=1 Tax=uncultured Algibacter sp. TaxID=298659 RepID=UPI0026261A80|nr:class I SAM-dependent methyltransferase [uncultured Algibacter sp.]